MSPKTWKRRLGKVGAWGVIGQKAVPLPSPASANCQESRAVPVPGCPLGASPLFPNSNVGLLHPLPTSRSLVFYLF